MLVLVRYYAGARIEVWVIGSKVCERGKSVGRRRYDSRRGDAMRIGYGCIVRNGMVPEGVTGTVSIL